VDPNDRVIMESQCIIIVTVSMERDHCTTNIIDNRNLLKTKIEKGCG